MYLVDKNLMPTPDVVKADPRSIEGLIAWLETRPSDGEYNWASKNCLIVQYAKAMGATEHYWDWLPDWGGKIGLGKGNNTDWTYGKALTRARAYRDGAR